MEDAQGKVLPAREWAVVSELTCHLQSQDKNILPTFWFVHQAHSECFMWIVQTNRMGKEVLS